MSVVCSAVAVLFVFALSEAVAMLFAAFAVLFVAAVALCCLLLLLCCLMLILLLLLLLCCVVKINGKIGEHKLVRPPKPKYTIGKLRLMSPFTKSQVNTTRCKYTPKRSPNKSSRSSFQKQKQLI